MLWHLGGYLLKAIVSFMRNRTYFAKMISDVKRRGMHGLAELLGKLSIPTFAKWRWPTLSDCCRAVKTVWESFRRAFDQNLFAEFRDSVELGRVATAVRDAMFTVKFHKVAWVSEWLSSLSSWIGGCSCHEAECFGSQTFVICCFVCRF